MLAKLVFVLVVFAADGTAQRFAHFDRMDQCEQFARSYNVANKGFGRAACVPENVQSEVDVQKELDQALNMMEQLMTRMNRAVDQQQKRKEM